MERKKVPERNQLIGHWKIGKVKIDGQDASSLGERKLFTILIPTNIMREVRIR